MNFYNLLESIGTSPNDFNVNFLLNTNNKRIQEWACKKFLSNAMFHHPSFEVVSGLQKMFYHLGVRLNITESGDKFGLISNSVDSFHVINSLTKARKFALTKKEEQRSLLLRSSQKIVNQIIRESGLQLEYDIPKNVQDFCEANEKRGLKFIGIKKIEEVEEELYDVSVADNHTVTYNGIVTHNTYGYGTLYQATEPTLQEQLEKDNIFLPLETITEQRNRFYNKLGSVKRFIKEEFERIEALGYATSFLGRRRYFDLGPKWKTKEYERNLQEAFRQGLNHKFQGSNADALKLANIYTYKDFSSFETPPRIILFIHDENVYYHKDEYTEDVKQISEKHMVEAGLKATGGECPIECSWSTGDTLKK